ncbi:glutaredoxin domain-containing protein [Schumannella soli]|uniref:NrdH-redoxin n=1 Tax=Schumannella soli TaxID=2590779 RepID=A0A506XZ24_9MICO|nr:glutaredoxin domain-containing protein [Schumannella soli]TPW78021.1 NrdH-redoxin [Schumannella soli]
MAETTKIQMYGADWCSDCRRSKALLDRVGADYEYIDIEKVDGGPERAQEISGRMNIPVLLFPDGSHQVEPSDKDLQAKLDELAAV